MIFRAWLGTFFAAAVGFFDWCRSACSTAWGVAQKVLLSRFAIIGAVCSALIAAYTTVRVAIGRALAALQALAVSDLNQSVSLAGTVVDWLGTANHLFPVAESLLAASLLFALWVAAITYRLIKSWVPTLS